MALKMPLELVLNFDGTVRRVHIVVEPTFARVLETIRMAYPNLNMEMLTLKYVDNDGDLCTLVDATFTDFLRCLPSTAAGSQGVLLLEPSPVLTAHPSLLEPQEDPWWDFHGKAKGKGKGKAKGKAEHCLDELWEFHHKGKGKPKGKDFEERWHGPEGSWWEAHGKAADKGKGKHKGKDFEELWEDFHGKGEEKGKGKGKDAFEEELWLWALKGKGKGQKGEDWHGTEEPWWEPHGKGAEKGKGKCKGKDFEECWEDFHAKGKTKGKGKRKFAFEEELWEVKGKGKSKGAFKGKGKGPWLFDGEEPWEEHDHDAWVLAWWDEHGKGKKGKKGKKGEAFGQSLEDHDWLFEMEASDGWWMDTHGIAPEESEMTALGCIEEEDVNRQSQHHQPSSL